MAELPPATRDHMNHVVLATARPLSVGFGLFILYTAIKARIGGEHPLINASDFLVAAYLLGLAAFLWWRPPDLKWMNLAGASIAWALAGTDMLTQSVRGSVPSFPAAALVLAGIGAVVLSWRWLLITQGTILTIWILTTQAFTGNPWSAWFIIQITIVTGIAIHWGRMRAYHQLIDARLKEEEARERLQVVNDELDQFAAVVAHDLKNPVAAIRLKAAALRIRAPPGDVTQRRTLEELDRVADGMTHMIDDLLQYARAGEAAQKREPVDLQVLAKEVQEVFAERLRTEGGVLDVQHLPRIEGDPTQIFQLLENLVGNALNYRRPDVDPVISITGQPRKGGIVLSVHDNGQGFDPQLAERMFQPFERGETKAAGHGLGLATCRRIAERHGGTITARSVPGHGSVFEVWLPQGEPKEHVN